MRILFRDDSGFTLVELLVAMVVTIVALLGLLSGVEVASQQNLRNQQRDEAIQVAEGFMNHWRAGPFGAISTCVTSPIHTACTATPPIYQYSTISVPSKLRGVSSTYAVTRSTISLTDGSAVDLGVRVKWRFKNMSTSHEVHTVRGG